MSDDAPDVAGIAAAMTAGIETPAWIQAHIDSHDSGGWAHPFRVEPGHPILVAGWRCFDCEGIFKVGQYVGVMPYHGKNEDRWIAEHRDCLVRKILPDYEVNAGSPDDLRAQGWMVAVHNDYRLDGQTYTFWLLTRSVPEDQKPKGKDVVAPNGQVQTGDEWVDAAVHGMQRGSWLLAVKGEGRTDAEALDKIRAQLDKPPSTTR